MRTAKINVALDERNRAMLSSRTYDKRFYPMKNTALPSVLRADISQVYKGLTGNDLPELDHTFIIVSDFNGFFKRVLSPCLYANEESGLFIKWGEVQIPITIEEGTIKTAKSTKNVKFSFKEEKIGKYDNLCLTFAVRSKDSLISMPIMVRVKDLNNAPTSDLLEVLVEEGDIDKIIAEVSAPPSGDGNKDQIFRAEGHLIKQAQLPVDSYEVYSYWDKDSKYGTKYYMTVKVNEPFSAMARVKENEEWLDKEVVCEEFAIVQANSWASKVLAAHPIIEPKAPATLTITDTYLTKDGKNASKGSLQANAFEQDENTLALDF